MMVSKAKKNKICFVRLLNGDDLIGEIPKKTIKSVTIDKPMLILNNIEMDEGKQTLILYPWIPQGICVGNTATLRTEIILFVNDVEPEIVEYYESICSAVFAHKPTITSSTVKKVSELEASKGLNIISFADASKAKKDLN
jgi:hypothetical protein